MMELFFAVKVALCGTAIKAIFENIIASAIYDVNKCALSKLFNRGSAENEYDRKLKSAFYKSVALKTKNKTIKEHIQERDLSKCHDLLIEDLKGNLSEESFKGRYFKDILKEFKAQLRKDPQFGNQIIVLCQNCHAMGFTEEIEIFFPIGITVTCIVCADFTI